MLISRSTGTRLVVNEDIPMIKFAAISILVAGECSESKKRDESRNDTLSLIRSQFLRDLKNGEYCTIYHMTKYSHNAAVLTSFDVCPGLGKQV